MKRSGSPFTRSKRQAVITAPSIWDYEPPESLTKTASALGELSAALAYHPQSYAMQEAVYEALINEHCAVADDHWQRGREHGIWLAEQEAKCQGVDQLLAELNQMRKAFEQLSLQHDELRRRHEACDTLMSLRR